MRIDFFYAKLRYKYGTARPSTSRGAFLCFDVATRIFMVKTISYRRMFCVTNKSPGGKLDYPNSGSGCTIEVPGTSVHFQGKFCGGTNIVHVLSFL